MTISPQLEAELKKTARNAARLIEHFAYRGVDFVNLNAADMLRPVPEQVQKEADPGWPPEKDLAGAIFLAEQLFQHARNVHRKHPHHFSDCKDQKCVKAKSSLENVKAELLQRIGTSEPIDLTASFEL